MTSFAEKTVSFSIRDVIVKAIVFYNEVKYATIGVESKVHCTARFQVLPECKGGAV